MVLVNVREVKVTDDKKVNDSRVPRILDAGIQIIGEVEVIFVQRLVSADEAMLNITLELSNSSTTAISL